MKELLRYATERCRDCGRGLTWIEVAFGRAGDPVCGRCLMVRRGDKYRDGSAPTFPESELGDRVGTQTEVKGGTRR